MLFELLIVHPHIVGVQIFRDSSYHSVSHLWQNLQSEVNEAPERGTIDKLDGLEGLEGDYISCSPKGRRRHNKIRGKY